jgi:amino-acid N-acetyltransferase
MTVTTPPLEPVAADRRQQVARLLATTGLPVEDLDRDVVNLYAVVDDGHLVGAGGLEPHGTAGLVRSLVVAEPHRGLGLGTTLADGLEEVARTDGIETTYLLSTSAAGFFRGRGYREVDRDVVPARIRETPQFVEHCPDTATCMRKRLD